MADATLMTGQATTDAGAQQPNAAAGASTQQSTTQNEGQSAQSQQQQAAGDANKSGEGKGDAGKAQGAPEKYDAFKLPEGVTFDAELTGEIQGIAKELNLSQEQAQKVADLAAKQVQGQADKQAEFISNTHKAWADSSRTDKEFGGEALNANLSIAQKALQSFATPELRQMLNDSGLGNHPEVIRTFYRVGKAISEDKLAAGSGTQAPPASDARSFYPKSNHAA